MSFESLGKTVYYEINKLNKQMLKTFLLATALSVGIFSFALFMFFGFEENGLILFGEWYIQNYHFLQAILGGIIVICCLLNIRGGKIQELREYIFEKARYTRFFYLLNTTEYNVLLLGSMLNMLSYLLLMALFLSENLESDLTGEILLTAPFVSVIGLFMSDLLVLFSRERKLSASYEADN